MNSNQKRPRTTVSTQTPRPAKTEHPAAMRSAARRASIAALVQLESSDRPLSAALDDALRDDSRTPRGFVTELVTGVCRHRARLDFTLQPRLQRPLEKLDAPVRAALRLALYERIVLQTPIHVVADEYVEAMRAARQKFATGFVNAVARRLPETWREITPEQRNTPAQIAIEYSHPQWLVKRWMARFGLEETRALCAANNEIAPLCVRVNTQKTSRDEVLHNFQERGLEARFGEYSAAAILVEKAGAPDHWSEWQSGLLIAQDEAAQLVSLFALHGLQPQNLLDLCAAPGGKATHLAQLAGETARVLACDSAAGRIKLVRQNAARLNCNNLETTLCDARAASTQLRDKMPAADFVLLDAPCSGTGTLRRRPDAKWRKTPAQLKELVALQRELLDEAAKLVAVGGVLVYSTCSLEIEENEEQARAFLQRHPEYSVLPLPNVPDAWKPLLTSDGFLQTSPARHGCDGAFAARFRRES